jgi:hypothetical protein
MYSAYSRPLLVANLLLLGSVIEGISSGLYLHGLALLSLGCVFLLLSVISVYSEKKWQNENVFYPANTGINPSNFELLLFVVSVVWFFFMSAREFGFSIDPVERVIFAEAYRNGAYKGSGYITLPAIVMAKYILAVSLFSRVRDFRSNTLIIASLFFLLFCSVFFGQRVFLFEIAFLFVALLRMRLPVVISGIVFFVVLAAWKLVLPNDHGVGFWDALLNPFTRLRAVQLYRVADVSGFSLGLDFFAAAFIPLAELASNVKEMMFAHYLIYQAFPNISLYSGLATPMIVFYASFGFFGAFFSLVFFGILTLWLPHAASFSRHVGIRFFVFWMLIKLSGVFSEDYFNFVRSFFLEMAVFIPLLAFKFLFHRGMP